MLRKLVPIMTLAAALCAPLAANAAAFHVRNASYAPIAHLLVSPADNPQFNPYTDEMLGSTQYIRPGQTWDFEFRAGDNCVFDMLAIFTDGSRLTHYNVDFCDGNPTWTLY
jgi:hypothetical protein